MGQDRIADSNLVTLGVNSRFFDANNGAELARFGVAQRYRFSDQLVRLPILLTSAGHNLKTDLGPMELGGLLTAMGTTSLDTKRLGGRPFTRNGLSYWDADWPARRSTDESNEGNDRYRFLF